MGYSKDEMETTLAFDYETGKWNVYSTVPKHIRKLMEIGDMKVIEKEDERPIAIKGVLNEKQVTMKKERIITEEQRQQIAERLKKARRNFS